MNRILLAGLLAAGFALASGGPALADDPPTGQFFQAYDKDRDGRVTPEEFAGDPEVFRLLDKDGDGAVTPPDLGLPADFKPTPGAEPREEPGRGGKPGRGGDRARARERLREMDRDGDGRVSREEFPGPAEVFDRLDRNKDGALDAADGGGKDGGTPGAPGKAPGGGMREKAGRLLEAMDKDGDGRVSRAEWTADLPFEKLDRNGDGFLDAADLETPGGPGGLRAKEPRAPGGPGGPGAPGGPGGPGGGRMPDPEEHFRALDRNADGRIGAEEAPHREMVAHLDKDGDGAVSLEEFRGGMKAREKGFVLSAAALERFDRDGDGRIAADEFPGREERFAQLDRNGDGFLTADDVPPEEPVLRVPEGAPMGPPAGPPAGPPRGERGPGPGGPVDVGALDRDGNGRLSRNEFPGPDVAWKRLDKNGDGWVTREEAGPPAPPVSPWLEEILSRDDADRDGRVSRAEWKGAPSRFDALDRNRDGFVDRSD